MAKYDLNIREGEVKNLVRSDWFANYDTNKEIGNIDLSVCVPTEEGQLELFDLDFFLWAEAKKGNKEDIDDSLVQLIITIMKARTYNDYLPPLFLGAFDAEKIAFVPYDDRLQRQVIFDPILENEIDWAKITPSDHTTPEFEKVKKKAKNILSGKIVFDFEKESKELRLFVKKNFVAAKTGTNKINITLNRMTSIFNRWLDIVKPTIKIKWTEWAEIGILPADFFLADVISKNNQSLGKSLQVLLHSNVYQVKIQTKFGEALKNIEFTDKQKAHMTFWNKYNRPPHRKERNAMQERRDLIVEPNRRERKGAYYTPPAVADLSREYLMNLLGECWQENYYVWDCCAGTGNLLNGLTEKERIFASTLDESDVTYMRSEKRNLLPAHVFQFDFLNDDLQSDKVPEDLRRILKDPEERKKLVIYINPPYAEASDMKTVNGGEGKSAVEQSATNKKYAQLLGQGNAEIFAQFLTRIYNEIPSCTLAEFSKLKILQGPHFVDFRTFFKAELLSMFIVPAKSFDNVKGNFPIGFMIWNTDHKQQFREIIANVYDKKLNFLQYKTIVACDHARYMNEWVKPYRGLKTDNDIIGKFPFKGNDFQNQNMIQVVMPEMIYNKEAGQFLITKRNVLVAATYFAVKKVIPATWLNDRDQFLFPRKAWKEDQEFQTDCLAYTLFNNNIQSQYGTNHWIPFTEKEVSAPMLFESHFMSDFIAGKIKPDTQKTLFGPEDNLIPTEPVHFSPEAQAVMDAGRELWKYYMWHKDVNVNASYYDIRRYFQGENKKGDMNPKSDDETYMRLWGNIKEALKVLAKKIEPKVYLYGFLLDETTLPEDEHEEVTEIPETKPAKAAKPKTKKAPKNQMVVNNYGTVNIYEK